MKAALFVSPNVIEVKRDLPEPEFKDGILVKCKNDRILRDRCKNDQRAQETLQALAHVVRSRVFRCCRQNHHG